MIGGSFLSNFYGTVLMGCVGSFYAEMCNVAFWTLVAGIAFGGSLLILAVRKSLATALGLCSD
jgi:POT family proton-dependent oligopeptide transporter